MKHTTMIRTSVHARQRIFSIALLLVMLAALPACTPWATYPKAEGGSVNLGGPGMEPIPTLETEAIRYAHGRWGGATEPVINLPPGTPSTVYDLVIKRLGKGRPMREAGEPAFEVREIRVRGFDAEVDLVYPGAEGFHQLATVNFKRDALGHFTATDARIWRVHAEPGPPNYTPAPPKPGHAPPTPTAETAPMGND